MARVPSINPIRWVKTQRYHKEAPLGLNSSYLLRWVFLSLRDYLHKKNDLLYCACVTSINPIRWVKTQRYHKEALLGLNSSYLLRWVFSP